MFGGSQAVVNCNETNGGGDKFGRNSDDFSSR